MSNKVNVDIIINNKPITKYQHEGDTFVEGRPNSNYKIRITNNHSYRVEAVISVDGLSIIDGELASDESRGYIIDGFTTVVLDGWRLSDTTVSEFVFGDKRKSYTNKLGNGTNNVGVIGVMVFEEEFRNDYYRHGWIDWNFPKRNMDWYTNNITFSSQVDNNTRSISIDNSNTRRIQSSSASINNMGTGFGDEKSSHVSSTHFTRSSIEKPSLVTLYYDDRKGLEARGIIVDQRKLKPDPFPASKYCKRV